MRRRSRLVVAALAAACAAVALLLGGVARSGSSDSSPTAVPAGAQSQLGAGFAAGDTRSLVAGLQRQLRVAPKDVHSLALLGLAYQ